MVVSICLSRYFVSARGCLVFLIRGPTTVDENCKRGIRTSARSVLAVRGNRWMQRANRGFGGGRILSCLSRRRGFVSAADRRRRRLANRANSVHIVLHLENHPSSSDCSQFAMPQGCSTAAAARRTVAREVNQTGCYARA